MKESEIRPPAVFEKYLELSRQDAEAMQAEAKDFVEIACPGCGSRRKSSAFEKNGFCLERCQECRSLFCSPRPNQQQLEKFYAQSPSSAFWAGEFFPQVAEVRREKLFQPKARMIFEKMQPLNFVPQTICDVGAGYGLLLEELARFWPQAKLCAIEPGPQLAGICRKKGFQVLEKSVEDSQGWNGVADLVTCFELIEHVFDPKALVEALYGLVRPAGFCLVTGLGGDGFDIQVLGKDSKSVFPPHHLNFLSLRGLKILFESAGFSDVEITTPGKLDVDIVANTLKGTSVEVPEFVRTLLDRGEKARQDFQQFLADHQLSSHVWILARR